MFTFLSVIHQNFEYNLRILANFLDFLNKNYTFDNKILFFTTKDAKSIVNNQVFSDIFIFLSVIRQNFEYNLRILANFRVKSQRSTDFAHNFSKNYSFLGGLFNKDYTSYTKNLFFTTRDAQSFAKISFYSNMFIFLSVNTAIILNTT